MHRPENTWIPGPIRARHEPPTIAEAITAAECVTDDPEEQAAFAASLMGISVEEVRPHMRPAGPGRRLGLTGAVRSSARTAQGAVVVERKIRRFVRAG